MHHALELGNAPYYCDLYNISSLKLTSQCSYSNILKRFKLNQLFYIYFSFYISKMSLDYSNIRKLLTNEHIKHYVLLSSKNVL